MKTDAAKPITLIVTIYPPKHGVRKLIVSGAPEGEMPVLLGGPFQDRHGLLDQAYAAVLKRDPQRVTIAEPKPSKKAKAKVDDDAGDDEAEETGDQLVEEDQAPIPSPSPDESGEGNEEELPAIEGDEASVDADGAEKFEEQLRNIRSPEESGEEVDDGEQD
jgi:hypothetical protein